MQLNIGHGHDSFENQSLSCHPTFGEHGACARFNLQWLPPTRGVLMPQEDFIAQGVGSSHGPVMWRVIGTTATTPNLAPYSDAIDQLQAGPRRALGEACSGQQVGLQPKSQITGITFRTTKARLSSRSVSDTSRTSQAAMCGL